MAHLNDLDEASPDEHRARYAALKARAASRLTMPVPSAPAAVPEPFILWREHLPPGAYASLGIARFRSLRLIDHAGTASVSFMAWNADDTSERYNSGDTVKLQWTSRLGAGRLLFSDMGRVIASIAADTASGHDALIGGSTRTTAARLGRAGRNARDNLVLAASKLGLRIADVPTPIAFFADLRTDDAGRFVWAGKPEPGRLVELRAEMNLLVAISNTAHPLDPDQHGGTVEAIVWRSPPPAPDDPARNGGEEALRGFENTDRNFEDAPL